MTSSEKFILNELEGGAVIAALLKTLDGKSCKFAVTALNTAKNFIVEDSQFHAADALKKIEALTETGKEISAQATPKAAVKKKSSFVKERLM